MIGSFVDCWHLFLLRPRQCWHRENFAFGMLLKVRWRRRRRFDKAVEMSIADLLPKTFLSFPEGRSSEISKYAADVRTDCEKIARVQSTMYRPEVSHSAQTKKSTQLCVHTHACLAIKASTLRAMQQIHAAVCLISSRESASARSWFLHSASLKSLCFERFQIFNQLPVRNLKFWDTFFCGRAWGSS